MVLGAAIGVILLSANAHCVGSSDNHPTIHIRVSIHANDVGNNVGWAPARLVILMVHDGGGHGWSTRAVVDGD